MKVALTVVTTLLSLAPAAQTRITAPKEQFGFDIGDDSPTPLRSGWAWGQKYLEGGVLALEAPVGKGRVLLFGPEILQRAQPHGTFKLLFNGIYSSVIPAK